MKKRYEVIGRFHGAAKGDILSLKAKDVEASGLLGSTLREITGEAAPEAVEAPAGEDPSKASTPAPGAAHEPQEPAQAAAPQAPAPKAETKTAAKAETKPVVGGPPMPGGVKPAVAPVEGK